MPIDTPGSVAPAVVLVDDKELRRTALSALLAGWSDEDLIDASSIDHVAGDDLARASLVIVNIGGAACAEPGTNGALRRIRTATLGTALAVISDNARTDDIVAGFEVGIDGYIPTTAEPQMALQTLQFIKSGGQYFPPAALVAISSGRREAEVPERTVAGSLTGRQRDVLRLLREGKSNKVIGRELDLQEATVKVHIRQIMRKLGVSNRTQAALAAFGHHEELRGTPSDEPEPAAVRLDPDLRAAPPGEPLLRVPIPERPLRLVAGAGLACSER